MNGRRAILGLTIGLLVGVAAVWGQPPLGPPRGPGGRPGFGPPGLGGPAGRVPPALGKVDETVPRRSESEDAKADRGRLIANADLEIAGDGGKAPKGFEAEGDFIYSYLGKPTT